jgi:hypothetical protein
LYGSRPKSAIAKNTIARIGQRMCQAPPYRIAIDVLAVERVREIQRFQTFKFEQGEFKCQRKAEFRAGSTQWLRPDRDPPAGHRCTTKLCRGAKIRLASLHEDRTLNAQQAGNSTGV